MSSSIRAVFDRFAARLSYVSGDFTDAASYARVGEAIKGANNPVFYLEIPPFLFGTVVKGLAEAGLTETARIVVEKPFGHDQGRRTPWQRNCTSTSTSRSCTGSTITWGRWVSRRSSSSGSPTQSWSRSGAVTIVHCVQITMAEDFGVEDRGHFYDPVGALRDVVVNHLMQVVAAAAMEPPSRGDPRTLKEAQVALFRLRGGGRPGPLCTWPIRRLPRYRRRRAGVHHRDLRSPANRDRELALVRCPLLHPYWKAPAH